MKCHNQKWCLNPKLQTPANEDLQQPQHEIRGSVHQTVCRLGMRIWSITLSFDKHAVCERSQESTRWGSENFQPNANGLQVFDWNPGRRQHLCIFALHSLHVNSSNICSKSQHNMLGCDFMVALVQQISASASNTSAKWAAFRWKLTCPWDILSLIYCTVRTLCISNSIATSNWS